MAVYALAAALLVAVPLPATLRAAEDKMETPTEAVRMVLTKVFRILEDPSLKVEIPMDYRLINKDGRWYAYDIVADGGSLVKNYRSQFDKIIGSESYAELSTRLRNRTVTEEAKKKRD